MELPPGPLVQGPGVVATTPERSVWKNTKAISGIILAFVSWLLFTGFFVFFVCYVLIQGNVEMGLILLDASLTNLLISIFSQLFVILAAHTIKSLLAALRVCLAMNGDTSLANFFGTGESAAWLSTLFLLIAAWIPDTWRRFRPARLAEGSLLLTILLLPLIGLAFSAVLKINASFEYYFEEGPIKIPVYAGLIPLDLRILDCVPPATLNLFFNSWVASLLTNNKYATTFPMEDCGPGCRSIFIPGGLETARLALQKLDTSLLSGGLYDYSQTIQVNNAPGIVLVFKQVETAFLFHHGRDCIYGGATIDDTVKLCIRQDGPSFIAGWDACPEVLYLNKTCSSNQTWASQPTKWATRMTAYKQFASTAYDRQNFSIINTQPSQAWTSLPLNASDFMTVWRRILISSALYNRAGISAVESLTYLIGWTHRTYNYTFPNDQASLVTNLHNFLAIPLQFAATAVQFCNYTTTVGFPMPDDALTTATNGWSSTRFVIQKWTGWTFIGASAALLVLVAAGIVFIICQERPLPSATGIPDVDYLEFTRRFRVMRAARRAQQGPPADAAADVPPETAPLLRFPHAAGVDPDKWTWKAARKVSEWTVARADDGNAEELAGTIVAHPLDSEQASEAAKD